jgi:hypothetical protein
MTMSSMFDSQRYLTTDTVHLDGRKGDVDGARHASSLSDPLANFSPDCHLVASVCGFKDTFTVKQAKLTMIRRLWRRRYKPQR